jgi:hypothetical protein
VYQLRLQQGHDEAGCAADHHAGRGAVESESRPATVDRRQYRWASTQDYNSATVIEALKAEVIDGTRLASTGSGPDKLIAPHDPDAGRHNVGRGITM